MRNIVSILSIALLVTFILRCSPSEKRANDTDRVSVDVTTEKRELREEIQELQRDIDQRLERVERELEKAGDKSRAKLEEIREELREDREDADEVLEDVDQSTEETWVAVKRETREEVNEMKAGIKRLGKELEELFTANN